MKLLSWFFILQALSLITVGLYQLYLREAPARLAFNDYKYEKSVLTESGKIPERVTIKDLDIDVPIYTAKVVDNKWPTTENGASYLITSPLPGTDGNSVMYAHNWKSLFGNLVNAKTGQEVQVVYPDKSVKTFVISYTSEVSPEESTILAPSTDKRITLYTCSGFLDSKRFVAVALLKS